jgi:hypothetical protein
VTVQLSGDLRAAEIGVRICEPNVVVTPPKTNRSEPVEFPPMAISRPRCSQASSALPAPGCARVKLGL